MVRRSSERGLRERERERERERFEQIFLSQILKFWWKFSSKWPKTDMEHLTVKSTLYARQTYPRGPNFCPFRPTTTSFRDTGLPKIEVYRMKPNWTWTLNSQEYPFYTKYPWGPNFGPFRPMISRFRHTSTRFVKIGMHQMTPNWTWTRNSQ